ncbi:hypothetical protein D3C80_1777260 [compost metagenome]
MRSTEEQAKLPFLQLVTQRAISDCRMRLRKVAQLRQLTHAVLGGFVTHRCVPQFFQLPDLATEQLFYARPVIRLADVHRIRQRSHRGMRLPLTIRQEARHGIVGIGRGDKTLHRQAQ